MKLLILFVLVLSAPFASAQWEHFDGLDSGVVTSLIVNGQRIYAASNYYGFVQSVDNGKTWNRVSPDTSFQGTIIYLLAVDSFLYASTYQNIYRSSDAGNTWKELPTPASFVSVRGLGVHNKKIYLSMDSIYR